ncbi:sporulation membrane protein YtaF [Bacillus atrophaeus]|uniref:sporulation membrane protein YtaF n=1 Tax=Bacillus atrophaeus TaxID=1452 RepID=UPI002280677D|nr:sporulation membrane protein YtaF [Bacillus atrophaeus]MCY8514410.1 sporulation membrane protein YtaF [Bacillus atrophaeus]MCY8991606.1 sporulation membrane protein YtaF [Bacillus atrophaeus]
MQMVSLLLVALAVSLDSFSVGFTYGLRKMRIPFKAIIVIACCSGAVMFLSMLIGGFLTKFFPVYVTEKLGGLILVGIGAWVLYQFFRPTKEQDYLLHEKTLLNLEVKSLGIVIHILRKPTSADIDRSGTINGIEALLLGFALSIDAFGAGIGAAILGFSPITLSFAVAIMSSLFVSIGIYAGHVLSKWSWIDKMAFLPGLLLITIGLWKL